LSNAILPLLSPLFRHDSLPQRFTSYNMRSGYNV
jgi:hypothetical protein